MVRITRQKVQQSRRRGAGQGGLNGVIHMTRAKLLEKDNLVGALALLGGGMLLTVILLYTSASSDSTLRANSAADPNHPNLHLTDKNAEQYNAIAQDILVALDCHRLLNISSSFGGADLTEGEGMDSNLNAAADGGAADVRRRLNDGTDDVEKAFEQDNAAGDGSGDGGGGGDPDVEEKDWNDNAESGEGGEGEGGEERFGLDDDYGGRNFGDWKSPTAKHLFCLAAYASNDERETGQWKDSIKCDATGAAQKSLLELWATARGEMAPDLLLKVLDMTVETYKTIVKKDFQLWTPREDTGLEYMVTHVNEDSKTVDQGGLYGLEQNLGKGKVFVDVGSCLGTTSMAISLLYPGTRVISIEAASPNWLLQEMNFRCNAQQFEGQDLPLILLTGVGPAHAATTFARYTWKPDQVTTARAWTPQSEISSKDVELSVKLRPWHSILAEAEIPHDAKTNQAHIDVLNVDCGACEYNLIPSMTDTEFDSIATVMGGLHWGYIPKSKLPSSTRGRETHERLCKHENFARTAKECCRFPNMEVISSYPGQVLVQDENKHAPVGKSGTVLDVAGELCDGYTEWAVEKHIDSIQSDWGWFQLTASAEDA